MKPFRLLSMPLLGKELIEAANRPRTYILRSLCAILALCFFGIVYLTIESDQQANQGGLLGYGNYLLLDLMTVSYAVVLLLLPIQSASNISQEKERGTLVLLLLTTMGPWKLVLQKWLSRVLAMLAMLLVIPPLATIAYTLGGVSIIELGKYLALLIICIIQVSAMSTAISAWSSYTTRAIMLALLGEIVLFFLIPMLTSWIHHSPADYGYISMISPLEIQWGKAPLPFAVSILYPLGFSLLMLAAARFFITRRFQNAESTLLLKAFRSADAALDGWSRASRSPRPPRRDLPLRKPILWYETNRRSLSSTRYLVRIFIPLYGIVPIMVPIWIGTNVTFDVFLCIEILTMFLLGAGCLAQEQSQQNLGVLITTPLTGSDIIKQKAGALSRLGWAMSGLLLAISLVGFWFPNSSGPYGGQNLDSWRWLILAIHVCIAIVLPPICLWFSIYIGISSRTQILAMSRVLAQGIGGLILLPMLVGGVLVLLFGLSLSQALAPIIISSPLLLLAGCQMDQLDKNGLNIGFILWFMLIAYLLLWILVRQICLRMSGRLLSRLAR